MIQAQLVLLFTMLKDARPVPFRDGGCVSAWTWNAGERHSKLLALFHRMYHHFLDLLLEGLLLLLFLQICFEHIGDLCTESQRCTILRFYWSQVVGYVREVVYILLDRLIFLHHPSLVFEVVDRKHALHLGLVLGQLTQKSLLLHGFELFETLAQLVIVRHDLFLSMILASPLRGYLCLHLCVYLLLFFWIR